MFNANANHNANSKIGHFYVAGSVCESTHLLSGFKLVKISHAPVGVSKRAVLEVVSSNQLGLQLQQRACDGAG